MKPHAIGGAPDQCRKRKNIVWTRGTTEAINMVAQCYARPLLQPGDEIVVSEAEHHANLVPWLMVAEQTGARVVKLPLGADLLPDVARLPELITPAAAFWRLDRCLTSPVAARTWLRLFASPMPAGWW
jgi:DNA-binding transcriptional MocR family regulator